MKTPVQVNVETKPFIAALKVVRDFVSEDLTRNALRHVHAVAEGNTLTLTATDGHTLCTATVASNTVRPGIANLSEGAIDVLLAIAKAEKVYMTITVTLKDAVGVDAFPEFQRAIPERSDSGKTDCLQGFNAAYLARIAAVQKALKATCTRLQFSEAKQGPLRADIKGDLGEATVVVMPVRL